MNYKLYRATDKLDNADSSFLVHPDGRVTVSSWTYSDEEEIELAKELASTYSWSLAERFEDAINSVLVAEWAE